METMYDTTTLVVLNCGQCGVRFAIPEGMQQEKRTTGDTFYCPNGHPRAYCDTEAKRLARELAATKARLDQVKANADDMRLQRDAAN